MTVQTTCMGKPLVALAEKLDQGWDIGLYGGDSSHVGAVSFAGQGGSQTIQRAGHRDALLSRRWADYLAAQLNVPVCVRCGVHFERFSKEDLPVILEASDQLMYELERMIP